MREYYGFMKEIKGVKGTVMGNFLNFFLSVREKKIKSEMQKGQAAIC